MTDTVRRVSTTRSLHNRNFRLYLIGQVISQAGSWFQVTAEIWLIHLITDSSTAIGIHSMLRFGPLLLFGIPAGLVTDRYDHMKLLAWTQGITGITAAVLAIASFSHSPSLLLVYVIVLARGIIFAIDNPLRRSFVRDLVSDGDLTNAVSLNSSANTVARSVGPALAGVLIAWAGVAWCFTINAVSYLPVLLTLWMIDHKLLRPARPSGRAPGQLREGLRYAWESRRIRRTLLMVAAMGLFPLNWLVILPSYSADTLHGDARLFGLLTSLMAIGAFGGALAAARLPTISGSHFRIVGGLMVIAFILLATLPILVVAIIGLALLGAAATSFQIAASSRLQLEADDNMSGRILAIYSVAWIGTRPIGGPITGAIVDYSGPRMAFAVSAVVVAVAVLTLAFGTSSRAKYSPRNLIRRSRSHQTAAIDIE